MTAEVVVSTEDVEADVSADAVSLEVRVSADRLWFGDDEWLGWSGVIIPLSHFQSSGSCVLSI